MITSSIDRRKDALRIIVDVPLEELLSHIGVRMPQFQSRLREYFSRIEKDVAEIAELISQEPETGVVKWFDESKGFGFIRGHDSQDVFVHWRGIVGDGFKTLSQGQRVRFKRRMGRETFEAIDVVPIESANPL